MISIIVIFGQDAVKYHEWTGQVPLDKFLSLNGGVVSEVKFNTQEEYSAYFKLLQIMILGHLMQPLKKRS